MLGSMYGDSKFVLPFNTTTGDASKMQRAFLGGGKMLSPDGKPRNTTISALITLTRIAPDFELIRALTREYPQIPAWDIQAALQESKPDYDPHVFLPRVIVWHNSFARMNFGGRRGLLKGRRVGHLCCLSGEKPVAEQD
jgi:hypothetical protein